MDQVASQVLQLLESQRPRPASVAEIAARLLLPPDQVYKAVLVLVQEHRIHVKEDVERDALMLEAV